VKTAAIVNYEKFVTHPAPAASATKDAKLKTKTATKTGGHRVSDKSRARKASATKAPAAKTDLPKLMAAKPIPVKKVSVDQSPIHQAALKQTGNGLPASARERDPTKNALAAKPGAATTAGASAGQKKPNAGIPKEAPEN
jgi:hypothetical protein